MTPDQDDLTTDTAPAPAADARNPAEPIGTPPGGGSWAWDIPSQAWCPLDAPSAE